MQTMTIQESELHAYLDGELDVVEATELEERLDDEPWAQELLARLAADKAFIVDGLDAFDPAVESLRTVALEKKLARTIARGAEPTKRFPVMQVVRMPLQAAAVFGLVAFGWWGLTSSGALNPLEGQSVVQSASLIGGIPEFVSEAVGAHRVFANDEERPGEFTAVAAPNASDWFSQKLGVSVAAPDLFQHGMTLVGARLLGTKEGPLAQYVYEDPNGNRLSLTLAKHPTNRPTHDLKFVNYPDRTAGYWTKGDIDYAFVSQSTSDQFQSLVHNVAYGK